MARLRIESLNEQWNDIMIDDLLNEAVAENEKGKSFIKKMIDAAVEFLKKVKEFIKNSVKKFFGILRKKLVNAKKEVNKKGEGSSVDNKFTPVTIEVPSWIRLRKNWLEKSMKIIDLALDDDDDDYNSDNCMRNIERTIEESRRIVSLRVTSESQFNSIKKVMKVMEDMVKKLEENIEDCEDEIKTLELIINNAKNEDREDKVEIFKKDIEKCKFGIDIKNKLLSIAMKNVNSDINKIVVGLNKVKEENPHL